MKRNSLSPSVSTAAGVDILWVLHLIDRLFRRRLRRDQHTDFPLLNRAVQLSPLPCAYSLLDPCFMKAKEAQRRSALRARHVMAFLLLDTFSRWIAWAAKQDANAMAVRRLVLGGPSSFTSNTTASRTVRCHDRRILSMFERWSNTSRYERQKPMGIRMGELPT